MVERNSGSNFGIRVKMEVEERRRENSERLSGMLMDVKGRSRAFQRCVYVDLTRPVGFSFDMGENKDKK